jgi:hypothetical protein
MATAMTNGHQLRFLPAAFNDEGIVNKLSLSIVAEENTFREISAPRATQDLGVRK